VAAADAFVRAAAVDECFHSMMCGGSRAAISFAELVYFYR
jgi:hypothetical protein